MRKQQRKRHRQEEEEEEEEEPTKPRTLVRTPPGDPRRVARVERNKKISGENPQPELVEQFMSGLSDLMLSKHLRQQVSFRVIWVSGLRRKHLTAS
ncbi:hypothetical protein EYF80_050779 [Liparis tanakae]|uniref:Uncharacterized protein n=1 Tax=Liparis tanakae TaxID=230148 RepID=A0A4Z2FCZ6_9TELE|nr:hypothetical protein EYF80_050779 [Liparis tanakae]